LNHQQAGTLAAPQRNRFEPSGMVLARSAKVAF
jgi:hypothetical protein